MDSDSYFRGAIFINGEGQLFMTRDCYLWEDIVIYERQLFMVKIGLHLMNLDDYLLETFPR